MKFFPQRRFWLGTAGVVFALLFPSAAAADWPGDVDLSFDPGSSVDGIVHAIARQEDRGILIGGDFGTVDGQPRKSIARLHLDGTFDSTFVDPGFRPFPIVTSIIEQPNGKILVSGWFEWISGDNRGAGVARLNVDGTLDSTFTGSDVWDTVRSMALQADGKIVIGGGFSTIDDEVRNGIARLNPDGTLDETFGQGMSGIGNDYPEGSGLPPEVMSVALQADGKILIGGVFTSVNGQLRNNVARLNPDGSLDESFGEGLAGTEFPEIPAAPLLARVQSLAIQADGKILLGGNFTRINGVSRTRIARLHADGTTDNSFGDGLAGADDWVWAIAILSDGKIAVGGLFGSVNGMVRNGIARLNPDGTLDSSFGKDQTGADSWVHSIVVQEDERMLIGGWFGAVNNFPLHRVARLYGGSAPPNEAPGDILLSNETVVENVASGDTVAIVTAVDPNERAPHVFTLVSGVGDDSNAFFTIEGNELKAAAILDHEEVDNHTVRIRAMDAGGLWVEKVFVITVLASPPNRPWPGDVDLSFEAASPFNDKVRAVARQDDGKWIVAGDFTSVSGVSRGRIARLNADGSLDLSFMEGLAGANTPIDTLAIQPDGRILIAGSFSKINDKDRSGLARLNEDGSLDAVFEQAFSAPRLPSLALQSDGKILVGGHGVLRLNRIGMEDLLFTFGIAVPPWANGLVHSIVAQADGNMVIGGEFTIVSGQPRAGVARLNPDGTLYGEFIENGVSGHVYSLAVQSDGKIIVGGTFNLADDRPRHGIARLNADGTVDNTFGDGLAGANGAIYSLALQSDGKILIGGDFTSINGAPRNRIARLNTNGTLDESFGADMSGADAAVKSVTLERDGSIMIAGAFSGVNGTLRSRVARVHGGNLPPSDLLLSRESVIQDRPIGITVGHLSAIDFGEGKTHTFTFASGEGDDGNAFFTIDGNALKTASEFDAGEQDTYSIRIRASNAKGLWVKRTFTITVEPDLYLAWAEQLPEGERGTTDDPGGFGIPNLMRYAFGMDPVQPEREKLPQLGQVEVIEDGHSQTYLTLTYTRRTDDNSLIYIAEASDDLVNWLPFVGVEETTDDANGETETVTLIDSEPMDANPKRFLRVRVER